MDDPMVALHQLAWIAEIAGQGFSTFAYENKLLDLSHYTR